MDNTYIDTSNIMYEEATNNPFQIPEEIQQLINTRNSLIEQAKPAIEEYNKQAYKTFTEFMLQLKEIMQFCRESKLDCNNAFMLHDELYVVHCNGYLFELIYKLNTRIESVLFSHSEDNETIEMETNITLQEMTSNLGILHQHYQTIIQNSAAILHAILDGLDVLLDQQIYEAEQALHKLNANKEVEQQSLSLSDLRQQLLDEYGDVDGLAD